MEESQLQIIENPIFYLKIYLRLQIYFKFHSSFFHTFQHFFQFNIRTFTTIIFHHLFIISSIVRKMFIIKGPSPNWFEADVNTQHPSNSSTYQPISRSQCPSFSQVSGGLSQVFLIWLTRERSEEKLVLFVLPFSLRKGFTKFFI